MKSERMAFLLDLENYFPENAFIFSAMKFFGAFEVVFYPQIRFFSIYFRICCNFAWSE